MTHLPSIPASVSTSFRATRPVCVLVASAPTSVPDCQSPRGDGSGLGTVPGPLPVASVMGGHGWQSGADGPFHVTRRQGGWSNRLAGGTNQINAGASHSGAALTVLLIGVGPDVPVLGGQDGGQSPLRTMVATQPGGEISQKGTPAVNTGRMTAKHLDTMDALTESIRAGRRKEAERLAMLAADEAQEMDYAFALSSTAMKENGVFGQRYQQLFREAEAFRAGMLERQKEGRIGGETPQRPME